MQELAGLRLPKWTKTVYPEPMQTLAAKYLELFTFSSTLQRLKAGEHFLPELLSQTVSEICSEDTKNSTPINLLGI